MPRYEEAPEELKTQVTAIARRHHHELCSAGVTIKTLLAFGADGSAAIKHAGWPAAGQIKITSHKDRVAGLADAVLLIDGDQIGEWSNARVDALIDHELYHLKVREKDGRILRDDCGRPKLQMRLHDAQLGVFYEIMERHGDEAIDTENVARLAARTKEWIQPLFDFYWERSTDKRMAEMREEMAGAK